MSATGKHYTGTITKTGSRTITVRLSSLCQDACSSCGHCGGANPSSHWELSLTRRRHPLLAQVEDGQQLTLTGKIPGPLFSALLLFGVPLLLTFGAAFLVWEGTESETWALIGGGGGFLSSALAILGLQRWLLVGENGFTVDTVHPLDEGTDHAGKTHHHGRT
ncbi:MAG: SoxR reducing system RseC family protein [Planctomycetota bacterium]|jgi:positive regulator of sigma E activity